MARIIIMEDPIKEDHLYHEDEPEKRKLLQTDDKTSRQNIKYDLEYSRISQK